MHLEFRNVDSSKLVNPEPIVFGSSPTTSERIKLITQHSSTIFFKIFPPLIFDRCFLTILISLIFAPQFSKYLFIVFLSCKFRGFNGETIKEDAPPDIKKIIKSFPFASFNKSITFLDAFKLLLSGIG